MGLAACGGTVDERAPLATVDAGELEAEAPREAASAADGGREAALEAAPAPAVRCWINGGATEADKLPCLFGSNGEPSWEWLEGEDPRGCAIPCPVGAECRAGPNVGVCR